MWPDVSATLGNGPNEYATGAKIRSLVESLDYVIPDRRFSSCYAEFLPGLGEATRMHDHPGVELIYALPGTLNVQIAGEAQAFESGRFDIFRFRCRTATSVRAAGRAVRPS